MLKYTGVSVITWCVQFCKKPHIVGQIIQNLCNFVTRGLTKTIIDTPRNNLDSPGKLPGVCRRHLRGCYKGTEARGLWGQVLVFNFLKSTPVAGTAAELRAFSFLLKVIISTAAILTPFAKEKPHISQHNFYMIQPGFSYLTT